jgi:hypothetical protein
MQEGKVYVKQGRNWIEFPEFLNKNSVSETKKVK